MLLIAGGAVAGVAWRLLLPFFLDHSDRQESYFAAEGCLAAVFLLAGLSTGMVVVFRPGHAAAARTTAAIAGSVAGALVAWLTGVLLGAPSPMATGILLIWPVVTSIVIFTGAMLPVVSNRIGDAGPLG